MLTPARNLALAVAAAGFLTACSDSGTGPSDAGAPVKLSIALAGGPAAPGPSLFAQGRVLTDGLGNTLEITSAEIVVREIEFKRVAAAECDTQAGSDDCEEFETDPTVLPLPLDGTVEQVLTAVVPEGVYEEVEFDIHKLDDSDPKDQALLQARPELSQVSIVVAGTFNGQAFEYTSDLDEEQEIEFAPGDELVVTADPGSTLGSGNVTLVIDLDTWFRDAASGALIDPATAVKGQPNEGVVTDNIRNSIEGFRDDDGDGIPHSDDDDEEAS
jgi:hypothetical protein